MRSVVWEQQLDGVPVFEGLLIGHITKRGELVNLSSRFLPNVVAASQIDAARRTALETRPPVSARQAVANAATNIGEVLRPEDVLPVSPVAHGPEQRQAFTAPPLAGGCQARLIWLPMSRASVHLCWSVELVGRSRDEMFHVLIDAQTGEALSRHCLTAYQSQSSAYRVFTRDSPSPASPGHQVPSSNQAMDLATPGIEYAARVLVDESSVRTPVGSPNGWINDGVNYTIGNNVDATLDRGDLNREYGDASLIRPAGSPYRVFDFALDLNQDPVTYTDAAVTQLFYWCNWMHDRLYDLGFVEGARNFQQDNFGRGGLGGDAVLADAQNGADLTFPNDTFYRNNSSFTTQPEGSGNSPRMQICIYDGPTPDRDADLDAEVILHEYTHGLSSRRVGGGVGIKRLAHPQAGGLGEGWSDSPLLRGWS